MIDTSDEIIKELIIKIIVFKETWCWRADSVVQSTGYSSREPNSTLSTHMVIHNCLSLQFQGTLMQMVYLHIQAKHMQAKYPEATENKGKNWQEITNKIQTFLRWPLKIR